jgi:transposase
MISARTSCGHWRAGRALAHALDGRSRSEAAGMERQTLSDWVRRSNEQGVEGLPNRPCAKRAPWRQGGAAMGSGRGRIRDLCELAEGRWRYSETGMLRLVKSLNLSRQKPRPAHPGARRGAQESFKKACRG